MMAGQLDTTASAHTLHNVGTLRNPMDAALFSAGVPAPVKMNPTPKPSPKQASQPRPTPDNPLGPQDQYPNVASGRLGVVYTTQPQRPAPSPRRGTHASTQELTPINVSTTGTPEPMPHELFTTDLERGQVATHTRYGSDYRQTPRGLTRTEAERVQAHAKAGCTECAAFLRGMNVGAAGAHNTDEAQRQAEAEHAALAHELEPRRPGEAVAEYIARVTLVRGRAELRQR